jgi:hypothetical protein
MEHECPGARLEDSRGEQGFVILNTQVGEERPPGEEEEEAGSPGAHAGVDPVRVATHDFSYELQERW